MMSAPLGPVMTAASAAPAANATTVNETVYGAVAKWAMRASHGRLTSWTVGGGVDALGIALFVPAVWPLALPFGCLASIGAWGLATRRAQALALADRAGTPQWRLHRGVRTAAVAVGTLLAIATFYTAMWLVFGTRWGPSGG